jgi:hypothetical protein
MKPELEQFIRRKLNEIDERTEQMAISQKTFDTDLAAFLAAFGTLITAVDALIAATPAADLTAEDTAVQAALTTAAAELNKLNPPTPVPTPAPVPPAPAA